jgi:hypothetical protein
VSVAAGAADLVRVRIERALRRRARYRWVRPRVEAEGAGWKVVSPDCSRRVDPQGGEIDIAWLLPAEQGRWLLHVPERAAGGWRLEDSLAGLDAALQRLCQDPLGRYWR